VTANISTSTVRAAKLQEAFQVDGQRAEYIVRKREELGGFESWDQFKQVVPGFEDKMVENLESAGLTLNARSESHTNRRPEAHSRSRSEGSEHANNSQHSNSSKLRDINEASAEELRRAFQVDGERAEYLVRKRQQLGGFSSWDQIKTEVPSFEDKMIRHLEEAGFTLKPRNKAA
jgi:DNA uptake protein ComE-like DNA-binding protein